MKFAEYLKEGGMGAGAAVKYAAYFKVLEMRPLF